MNFATLGLILAISVLGALLSLPRRAQVPVVVGELLVGIVLGRTGAQLLQANEPTFQFMAEIGFALVMFVAGTHVPVRNPALKRGMRIGFLRAALIGVLAVGAGHLIAGLLAVGHGWLFSVLIASSSAALVMPVLSRADGADKHVLHLLPQIAVADAACIIALPLVIDPARVARVGTGSVLILAAGAMAFFVFWRAERSGLRRRVHTISEERGLAIELRVILAVLCAVSFVAAVFGVSVMLAGFCVGLAVSAVGEPRRVAKQLFALTDGFFAPIFYVWFGASLNLRALATHPTAVALGIALGVAALVCHSAMVLTGQPWRYAGLSAGQLGVPVAAAALGNSLMVLRAGEDAAMLLGALITMAVCSMLARGVGSAPVQ